MATKKPGGKITPIGPAITFETDVAMVKKDPVMIPDGVKYEVVLADGTKPTVGHVEVGNVKRSGPNYPVADTPNGEVTVACRGLGVETFKAAGAVESGVEVGFDADRKITAVGAGVPKYGVSLTNALALNDDIDVLIQAN